MGEFTNEPELTGVASRGVLLADAFGKSFANVTVRGVVPRRARLTKPEGPSTMGGTQAEQHLTLEPEQPGQRTLTVGHASVPQRRAVLRTYRCLQEMHAQRFGGEPFDLDPAYYQVFFDRVRAFFAEQGMPCDLQTRAPAAMAPAPPDSTYHRTVGVLLVIALVAAAVALWQLQAR